MAPDDRRHGTNAGYIAGCRHECCRAAAARYHRGRAYDQLRGIPRKVPALGAQRRLQALVALGWSFGDIARRLGCARQNVHAILSETFIHARRHNAITAVYDALSMTVPEGPYATRSRRYAARHGWAPPFAWEGVDIDDPTAEPLTGPDPEPTDEIDWVVVERILDQDPTPARAATPAERVAVVAAWTAAGRSLKQLARLTGWKVERYYAPRDAA